MTQPNASNMFLNYVLSSLMKKVIVPSEYHARVDAVKGMLQDDVSGMVDSLTDFSVQSAGVNFSIETSNSTFTEKLKYWLDNVNKDYNGKVPRGINALASEYFKERWKSSSFPILKITKWKKWQGIKVPSQMFFVDGASVYSDNEEQVKTIDGHIYCLGKDKKDKLDKGVIITKPYSRWFDEYPNPYLIKRGVYHNWKIIESLKNRETEILEQIIPYLLLVKKGSDALAVGGTKIYSQPELQEILKQFQDLMTDIKTSNSGNGSITTPARVTNYDEEIEHLIPDLSTIFNPELFTVAERAILSGLGFIDIAEAVSTSRRESILNPKAFIEEINIGVKHFKENILTELVYRIIEENEGHRKYINSDFFITSSPVKSFMTDDFKEKIRQLYDRGCVSAQTAIELIGEVDFRTEVHRREKEAKEGIELVLYPHLIDNKEDVGIDLPGKPSTKKDTDEEDIPDDKTDPIEKKEYDIGAEKILANASYKSILDLPQKAKSNLSLDLQKTFLTVLNNSISTYENESRAFRTSWSVIKNIGRLDKKGTWVRKNKRVDGKLKPIKLTKAMLVQIIEKQEKQVIKETLELQKLEINEKKLKLLNKLSEDKGK